MKLTLSILRYLVYGPAHWLITIISYILVPFLVLFQKDAWLPNWCWWFQTWDNSLDGDNGWQIEHRPYLDIPYNQLNKLQLYISRVLWLYRNPVYGFERKVLAAYPTTLTTVSEYPNRLILSDNYYFFWNGEKQITSTKKVNWLIGWKLTYPDRPIPICSTLRIVAL
jgi:hypothetical protein